MKLLEPQNGILKVAEEKLFIDTKGEGSCQPRILYGGKQPFVIEEEIYIFLDKQKLETFSLVDLPNKK